MKRIVSLIMVFSMVFCACGRKENEETVSNSGSGVAAGNTVTESAVSSSAVTGSAVSGAAAGEEKGAETEKGFELDPDMKLTMARKDEPMLSEKADQTRKSIELGRDPEFATALVKGDDGNCYYFRYQKKNGKLTFYKNNAIKVCETVLPEQYKKDYYIVGFIKQGRQFWVKFTSYEDAKYILVPVQIKDGKWGKQIRLDLQGRIIYYEGCFYSFDSPSSFSNGKLEITDKNGDKKYLDLEEKYASLQMIVDDKLYYIIEDLNDDDISDYIVMRCSMDGSNKEELFRYSMVYSTNRDYCKLTMDGDFLYLFDPYCRFTLTRIPLYGGEPEQIARADWYDLTEDSIYYLSRKGKIWRVDKDLKGKPELVMSRSACEIWETPFLCADGHLMVEDYNKKELRMLFTVFVSEAFERSYDICMNYSNIYYWVKKNGKVEDTSPSSGFLEEYYEWYEWAREVVDEDDLEDISWLN